MRLIDVDAIVTVKIYDENRKEYFEMDTTVEKFLNTYTSGCPVIMPEIIFHNAKQLKMLVIPKNANCEDYLKRMGGDEDETN